MAFPNLITSSANVFPQNPGPIQIGTALYVSLINFASSVLEMFKSIDGGLTWVVQDSASSPASNSGGGASIVTDGNLLYVLYVSPASGKPWQISIYDPSGDTWGSTFTSTFPSSFSTPTANQYDGIAVYRPLDKKIISVITTQPTLGVTQSEAYFLFDTVAQTYSVLTLIGGITNISPGGNQYICQGVVRGNGMTHFFLVHAPTGSSPWILYQQPLSDTNSLGSPQQISSNPYFGILEIFQAFGNGISLIVAYQTAVLTVTAYEAISAIAPTWSGQALPVSGTNFDGVGCAINGSIFYLVVVSDNGSGLYTFSYLVDSGAGFGVAFSIGTSTLGFSFYITLTILAGGTIAIVFNGTVYYWSFSPSASTPVALLHYGGVGIQSLPSSSGSICKYGRVLRCSGSPSRTILSSPLLVYGGGK
jgi:hypothetical protein